jgi:hypothetical protein
MKVPMKKIILLLLLITNFGLVKAQETTYVRKGLHLGAHVTPGIGTVLTEAYDNLSVGFGMNAGLDLNYYFNDLLGIRTGISYFNLPWRYEFYYMDGSNNYKETSANVHSIGLPVQFLLTTGKSVVGFYLEAGFAVYFPVSYRSDLDRGILKTSTAMFSTEIAAGINLKANDKINFQIAAFSNTSFPVFSNLDESYGFYNGLKLGMTINLSE